MHGSNCPPRMSAQVPRGDIEPVCKPLRRWRLNLNSSFCRGPLKLREADSATIMGTVFIIPQPGEKTG